MEATAIEERLLGLPFLSAVEPADLHQLAQAAELLSYHLGQLIYHAGDASRGFFIVLSGRVRVFGERDAKEHVVGTLEAGDHFGEEAVLRQHPYEYSTRAAQDTVAIRISEQSLQQLLTRDPGLRTYLQQYVDDVSIRSFLKLFTLLTPLSARNIKALLGRLEERSFEKNEYVFRQGDAGDAFFIVRSGRVEVLREGQGRVSRWREIGPGGFFGEVALMSGEPRGASIRCIDRTELFRLGRSDFDELVAHEPAVKKSILEVTQHYQTEEALRQQWKAAPPELAAPRPPSEVETPAEATVSSPRPRWFGRFPFLRQHDASDCGAASLGMVLRYHGTSVSLSRLRDLANVSRDGASLLSLARAAEKLGLQARGLRVTADSVPKLQLPAIVHWEGNHYVVLYQVKDSTVLLGDPAVGMRRLSRAEFEQHWTGNVLELHPTAARSKVEGEVPPLTRFLPLLRPHLGVLVEILLATLLLDILGLAGPVFTQTIVDEVLIQHRAALLPVIVIGMVIVLLSQTGITAIRQYLLNHCSNRIDLTMLVMFYRHLLGLPVEYFNKRRIGDFISRFAEAARIRELITGTAITTLLDVLMLLVYIGLMLYYSLKLSLVVLAFVPLYGLVTAGFTPPLKRANRDILNRHQESQSFLVESISGVETVKTLAVEQGVRWRWEGLYVRTIKAAFRARMLRLSMETASGLLSRGAALILLCYGAVLVLHGDMTVGELMAFNLLMASVLAPVSRLMGLWDSLQETLVSVERLNEVMDSELEEPDDGVGRVTLARVDGHIKLENVCFRYRPDDDRNVIDNVNLDVYPGQTVAIVGRSGCGKTTLARLMIGLYRPTSGTVRIDNHDLRAVELASYRQQIGVVMQDSLLFSGTILENIALGDPEPDFERVERAATLAAAADFITAMPLGYSTIVGERGLSLSGGQRQRIAIARALYHEPRILVLDEATSSLDLESERAIQNNLRRYMEHRTAIVIAHRLSTVQEADLIVVLDQGVVVETGKHTTLMETKGLYYYLQSQQLHL